MSQLGHHLSLLDKQSLVSLGRTKFGSIILKMDACCVRAPNRENCFQFSQYLTALSADVNMQRKKRPLTNHRVVW